MIQTILSVLTCLLLIPIVQMLFFRSKWDPSGRHCYITGGSSGLGLALAVLLTKKGAHVSIVARNEQRLQKALEEIETVRQTPGQILKAYAYALDNEQGAAAALEAACEPHGGRSPDALFLCAGKSTPGFFVEQDEASMRAGMDQTYWVQASTALVAGKRMAKRHEKGKIVFISSVLGYFSIVGYSTYSPGKFALRGLAEALQSEFMLYGIDIHICFPGTIFTPGYEEENKTKPNVTLKIEESDDGAKPEVVAEGLLRGVQNGNFHITYDFISNVFRSSTAGSSPRNNVIMDMLYGLIGFIALPIWRRSVDSTVRSHRNEHAEYLASHGMSDRSQGALKST